MTDIDADILMRDRKRVHPTMANGGGGHSSAAGFGTEVDGNADPVATLQRVLA